MSNPIQRCKSYAVSGRPDGHSEPNIIDSIGLHLPQERPCGPRCSVTPGRTAAVILAKRNAPFYRCKINDLRTGVGNRGKFLGGGGESRPRKYDSSLGWQRPSLIRWNVCRSQT